MPARVIFVLKGYPRLSETFIAQEILALEARGLDILIVSLREPTDGKVHELHRRIRAPVLYLPEYLRDEPVRVLRALAHCLTRSKCWTLMRVWLRDFLRDRTRSRLRRLGQAFVLAAELPADVGWLHSHFIHTSASVTRYTSILCQLPFSISAHAKDVWTSADWDKREKMLEARWTVTCSAMNAAHLRELAPEAALDLVYHGVDPRRFPAPLRTSRADGGDPAQPVTLVCVARAVEKKGLDVLLDALASLPSDLHWQLDHLGDGPLLQDLKLQARELGIAGRISWHGSATQSEVIAALSAADIFCLPARIARDGDRDGLPNVILEAMVMALPVVATRVAAIAEALAPGISGLLVEPDRPQAFAAAVEQLARDPSARLEMGTAGRGIVLAQFGMDRGIEHLARRFGLQALRRVAA